MWATSGRSMRRASARSTSERRGGGDRRTRRAARRSRAPGPGARRAVRPPAGRARSAGRTRLLLAVGLEAICRTSVRGPLGGATRGLAEPVDPDLHVVVGHRRPVLRLLERLAGANSAASSGVLLPLGARDPAADPDEARDPVRDTPARCPRRSTPPASSRRAPPGRCPPRRSRRSGPRGSRTGRPRSRSVRSHECRSGRPGAGHERVPLRVPHPRVGDPGVDEHDRAPLAGPLRPEAAADGTSIRPSSSLTRRSSRSRWTAPASGRRQWVIDIAWT